MSSVLERSAVIYVVSHLEGREEEIVGHRWVYAGEAGRRRQTSSLTDVCTTGASLENSRWSELSAIYKIWKEGPRTDVVGFCHYRRFFAFGAETGSHPVINIKKSDLQKKFPENWDEILDRVDLENSIVPERFDLGKNVYAHYLEFHNSRDYIEVMNAAVKMDPQLRHFIVEQFSKRQMYACNMFIMAWENFDALCRFWFGVLQPFAEAKPWPRENAYQSRDVSFLAERLFDVWICHKQSTGHSLLHVPMYFVKEPAEG